MYLCFHVFSGCPQNWHILKSYYRNLRLNRLQILQGAHFNDKCVCNGEWLACAEDTLLNNGVSKRNFGDAVKTLLEQGRGNIATS